MRASKTEDVANIALDMIGELHISDIDDTSDSVSVLCKKYLNLSRIRVLEEVDWVCPSAEKFLSRVYLPASYFKQIVSDLPVLINLDDIDINPNDSIYSMEYPFVFAIPPNFVRAIKAFNGATKYGIKVRQDWTKRFIPELGDTYIVSRYPSLKMLYVYDVQDPSKWDAHFLNAVTMLMAFYLSTPIKRDAKLTQSLYSAYKTFCSEASVKDMNENAEDQNFGDIDNEFTDSRSMS